MRGFVLGLIRVLAVMYQIIPAGLRRKLVFGFLMLESRIGGPADALRHLYPVRDDLERLLSERAMAYEGGEHPKHRLMRYHDFFVDHIPEGSRVVDIGCGYGAVARSIALRVHGSRVSGVEMDQGRYDQALAADNPDNLDFLFGDAFDVLPEGDADIVVLSNVLEHIDDRQAFLHRLRDCLHPDRVLIRVPLFEREWHVPMRQELGISYFNDRTHFIEHRRSEFRAELDNAGYVIEDLQTVWGEIWAVCLPENRKST